MTATDLATINQIVQENNLNGFDIVMTSGSGIGYRLDLEFETKLHDREVTVRVPVSGVENW